MNGRQTNDTEQRCESENVHLILQDGTRTGIQMGLQLQMKKQLTMIVIYSGDPQLGIPVSV